VLFRTKWRRPKITKIGQVCFVSASQAYVSIRSAYSIVDEDFYILALLAHYLIATKPVAASRQALPLFLRLLAFSRSPQNPTMPINNANSGPNQKIKVFNLNGGRSLKILVAKRGFLVPDGRGSGRVFGAKRRKPARHRDTP
jgi:hypothetical protein